MPKSTKKSIEYMYISLFLFIKSRQYYVNSMISIISLIYESCGTYSAGYSAFGIGVVLVLCSIVSWCHMQFGHLNHLIPYIALDT